MLARARGRGVVSARFRGLPSCSLETSRGFSQSLTFKSLVFPDVSTDFAPGRRDESSALFPSLLDKKRRSEQAQDVTGIQPPLNSSSFNPGASLMRPRAGEHRRVSLRRAPSGGVSALTWRWPYLSGARGAQLFMILPRAEVGGGLMAKVGHQGGRRRWSGLRD